MPCRTPSYIGFTGTPSVQGRRNHAAGLWQLRLNSNDFQRAVKDKATVPLYYDARGDNLAWPSAT